MLRKLRPRSVYDVMAAVACFGVLAGGTAYAAATITGAEVVDESLTGSDIKGKNATSSTAGVNGSIRTEDVYGQPANPAVGQPFMNGGLTGYDIADQNLTAADIAPNSVTTSEARDNAFTGTDINESTLAGVDAASVGGVKAVKIHYERPQSPAGNPPSPEVVLNLGGLVMRAECRDFGDVLDVKAFTTKQGASVFLASTSTGNPDDTNGVRDTDGNDLSDGAFDTDDVLEVDNEFPNLGTEAIGTLIYEAPGGSAVVVHLSLDEGSGGCTMAGVAIGS